MEKKGDNSVRYAIAMNGGYYCGTCDSSIARTDNAEYARVYISERNARKMLYKLKEQDQLMMMTAGVVRVDLNLKNKQDEKLDKK